MMDSSNGYNAYNLGGGMVDEAGNPLKNRFGMKLAFSILEMFSLLLCGVLSFILGLLGCVYTCKANNAYKQGDAPTFLAARKNSAVCLWIGGALSIIRVVILAVVVALAAKAMRDIPALLTNPDVVDKLVENGMIKEEDAENLWILEDIGITDLDSLKNLGIASIDDLKNLESLEDLEALLNNAGGISIEFKDFESYFLLDDKVKKVPVKVSTFLGKSYVMTGSVKSQLGAGETAECSFCGKDTPGTPIGTLVIKNLTNEKAAVEDAQVVAVSLSRENVIGKGHSFMMTTGINFSSQRANVEAYFGKPEKEESKGEGLTVCGWNLSGNDGKNYMEITFSGDTVMQIDISWE